MSYDTSGDDLCDSGRRTRSGLGKRHSGAVTTQQELIGAVVSVVEGAVITRRFAPSTFSSQLRVCHFQIVSERPRELSESRSIVAYYMYISEDSV